MIVEKFRRSHTPVAAIDAEDGVVSVPVLKTQMPASPDERHFFGAILEGLGMANGQGHHCCAAELGDAADVEGGCADARDR
ncbi:TniB family NTP-binding protein [Bradyrhizobium sp. AC87j1]|uniref:TniB family NTP-binding protein n=1 Tax=Bradyrhizobium sp. AC87j1 TaxID=2055894 RepID=UPI00191BE07B|nr:TniB family NTP-binding protein [Bradyrhizobium sp. AC87j1]